MNTFTMTEDHIDLIRHMHVGWSHVEFGAQEIDPKRPYGNSDVMGDIAEILGQEIPDEDEDEEYQAACDRLEKLHQETVTALQIILVTGSFAPGNYVKGSAYDDRSWRLARVGR